MVKDTISKGRFWGKVAIVTGGSQGIGRAVALGFAREGGIVVICARRKQYLDGVQKEITHMGATAMARSVDISNKDEVDSLVKDTVNHFGKLDIIVCNAGIRSTVPFDEIDDSEWYRVLDIDLKGTFYCCRVAMKYMKGRGFGRIVNISSIAGEVGGTLVNAPYSAAKAGIICLTKVGAKIMAPYGVTVNCVAPGTIDTPFIEDYDDKKKMRLRKLIPLDRLGTGEDVAGAVLFLASDEAGWITGITLDVNGGQLMR